MCRMCSQEYYNVIYFLILTLFQSLAIKKLKNVILSHILQKNLNGRKMWMEQKLAQMWLPLFFIIVRLCKLVVPILYMWIGAAV